MHKLHNFLVAHIAKIHSGGNSIDRQVNTPLLQQRFILVQCFFEFTTTSKIIALAPYEKSIFGIDLAHHHNRFIDHLGTLPIKNEHSVNLVKGLQYLYVLYVGQFGQPRRIPNRYPCLCIFVNDLYLRGYFPTSYFFIDSKSIIDETAFSRTYDSHNTYVSQIAFLWQFLVNRSWLQAIQKIQKDLSDQYLCILRIVVITDLLLKYKIIILKLLQLFNCLRIFMVVMLYCVGNNWF